MSIYATVLKRSQREAAEGLTFFCKPCIGHNDIVPIIIINRLVPLARRL